GRGAGEVELDRDALVRGLEHLADLLEGLLEGGGGVDPQRDGLLGAAIVGGTSAPGQQKHRSCRGGGEPGRARHDGSASMTTWVAFTTALATAPGARPSSRAASLLISETTRKGPHCSSTCAITVSMTTSVTRPVKRFRAEEAAAPCSSGVTASSRASRATSTPSS